MKNTCRIYSPLHPFIDKTEITITMKTNPIMPAAEYRYSHICPLPLGSAVGVLSAKQDDSVKTGFAPK